MSDCTTCDGIGRIPATDAGVPGDRFRPCPVCSMTQCRLNDLEAVSRVPSIHIGCTFDDLSAKNFKLCGGEVSEGDSDFEKIVGIGIKDSLETGKDFSVECQDDDRVKAATILAREIVLAGYEVLFVCAEDIVVSALEATKYNTGPSRTINLEKLTDVDVLVIDEANELCSLRFSPQARPVINGVFKSRVYGGRRNFFMLSEPVMQSTRTGTSNGFVHDNVFGARKIIARYKV